ncbi:hypothetical protein NQK81_01560 [Amycolatopsis roodepoortensis]|uniref:hypothetical protein n=1 Tax=Amycolatopsis roodepoortensis TaxID=700274 RepID=UPI00214BD8E6|nr:hypothetical protein [Amycolatopsis roodepoortensis]UUV32163.1 hypothetical protein NQK81_01560 [Amycolatopsis roodepoortensis]
MDAETVLEDLLSQHQALLRDALIVDGAQRLYARGAGTAAECLHTSMIWFYGRPRAVPPGEASPPFHGGHRCNGAFRLRGRNSRLSGHCQNRQCCPGRATSTLNIHVQC